MHPAVFRRRALDIALQQQPHHLLDLTADQMRRHADHPVAAHRHDVESFVVVAAPDQKAGLGPVNDAGDLIHIAARLFDADNVVDFAEPDGGFVAHIQTGAAGDVVHNGRQTGAFRDGLKVPVQPFLRRFVVVRHYQQQAVNALPFGLLGKLDAFGGAVIAGAGDDRAPVANGFLNLGIQPQFFPGSQGRRLAGSSRHDHPVAAGIKKGVGEPLGLGVIHLALGVKRRNHRRDKPAQLSHSSPPYIVESATRGIPKRQSCAYYTPAYPRRNPANPTPPKFPNAPAPAGAVIGNPPR